MTEDTSPDNLRKILESDDPAMVRMGLSMAKNIDISEDFFEIVFKLSIFNDEKEIREEAHSIAQQIQKLENSAILNLLIDLFQKADDAWTTHLADPQDVRTATMSRIVEIGGSEARDLLLNELELDDEWWISEHIIEALGKIGDEEALDVLDRIFDDECEKLREFYMENPNSIDGPDYRSSDYSCLCYQTASAIARIGGNKAQKILLSYVKHNSPWWSSNVTIGFLKNLGWEPKDDKERISELIAEHKWEDCKEMGDYATVEAIASILDAIYYFERSECVLDEIVEAINSFGKDKFISIIDEEELWSESWSSIEETIETIESIIEY